VRSLPDFGHSIESLPDARKIVLYRPAPGRPFVPIVEMPALVIHAFLAAEDADFYRHSGINLPMVLRAAAIDVYRYTLRERPLGASTITQQLVKNLLLNGKPTLRRKVREALLALRVERALSKDRILEIYLNEIYLGCGAHGVAEAARNYFGKPVGALTTYEAAFLAALPKAPSHYNPLHFHEAALARRDWVLDRMAEDGYLSPSQASISKEMPLNLSTANSCVGHPASARHPPPQGRGA
jgi:penicillin-binding protein 1A